MLTLNAVAAGVLGSLPEAAPGDAVLPNVDAQKLSEAIELHQVRPVVACYRLSRSASPKGLRTPRNNSVVDCFINCGGSK